MLTIPPDWKPISFQDVNTGDTVCIRQEWGNIQRTAYYVGQVQSSNTQMLFLGHNRADSVPFYAVDTDGVKCSIFLIHRPPTTRKLTLKDLLTLPLKSKISFTTKGGLQVTNASLMSRSEDVAYGWMFGYLHPEAQYNRYIRFVDIDPNTIEEIIQS